MKCKQCGKASRKALCSLSCQKLAHLKKLGQVAQIPQSPLRQTKPKKYMELQGAPKKGGHAELSTPVRKERNHHGSDGFVARIRVNGETWAKWFGVSKYGEKGARLAASLQRMLWAIELGVWDVEENPDPFRFLGFEDFQPQHEEGTLSPYTQEREEW